MLIILGGLPGVGKTTIARELAHALGAVHVSIDSIEQAIRASSIGTVSLDDAGYRVGYAVAADVTGLTSPSWEEVVARDYRRWDGAQLVLDTAHRTSADCVAAIVNHLASKGVNASGVTR